MTAATHVVWGRNQTEGAEYHRLAVPGYGPQLVECGARVDVHDTYHCRVHTGELVPAAGRVCATCKAVRP